ncbi:MAG: GNAT family N-acetyltransferase [Ruminococcaceae bacterium]|nr:GNAT family N-acetyltransferase [Oscillospiraceae bacterium]
MKLEKATISDFDEIFCEMEKNFIYEEIRDRDAALEVMSKKEYSIFHILDGEQKVGFITVWELEEFAFAEHFVIYEKYRNCGYGSKGMRLLQERFERIILEVEHPEDELKARRIAFYKRLGFCQNDYPYIQPSYRKGGKGVPLILMSYPKKLDNCENTASVLYKKIYNK